MIIYLSVLDKGYIFRGSYLNFITK